MDSQEKDDQETGCKDLSSIQKEQHHHESDEVHIEKYPTTESLCESQSSSEK